MIKCIKEIVMKQPRTLLDFPTHFQLSCPALFSPKTCKKDIMVFQMGKKMGYQALSLERNNGAPCEGRFTYRIHVLIFLNNTDLDNLTLIFWFGKRLCQFYSHKTGH